MSTLSAQLDSHASSRPHELAVRFLPHGEVTEDARCFDFAALRAAALGVAQALSAQISPGDRALLLYDSGVDFLPSLLGCFYAGVIAVPTYPPDARRLQRTLPRLRAIAADAGAQVVLTTSDLQRAAEPLCQQAASLRGLRWIASDTLPTGDAVPQIVGPNDLAYLQYTSGSTGTPKGVAISHGNLHAICHDMLDRWHYDADARQVSWLPTFHDLGLIWGLLTPLLGGFSCTFMPPVAFVQRPRRWLEVISAFAGTHSAAPDFGYALCTRKVQQLDGLDISSWRAAMNAAEPVRASTVRGFSARFAEVGFEPQALCPWYGLAEATLQVSLSDRRAPPTIVPLDASALEQGRVLGCDPDGDSVVLAIGNGWVVPGSQVAIVDAERRLRLPDDRVGEIWVRGPGVAQGYWNQPQASTTIFEATIEGEPPVHWMRTGDLGFVLGDELFVTGRAKDLIIVRGRNLYPQDLERSVEAVHPAVRPGCAAAFALEVAGEERVGLVAEIDPKKLGTSAPDTLLGPMREALAEGFDLAVHAISLIPPRAVPKTSSGKIQRGRARHLWLTRGYDKVLAAYVASASADTLPTLALADAPEQARVGAVTRWLHATLVELLGRSEIDPHCPLWDLGLDSMLAVDLTERLSAALGRDLPVGVVFDYPTLHTLAASVAAPVRISPGHPAADSAASVTEMTEAEAEAALLAELDQL